MEEAISSQIEEPILPVKKAKEMLKEVKPKTKSQNK
jgi:hypothetical protein